MPPWPAVLSPSALDAHGLNAATVARRVPGYGQHLPPMDDPMVIAAGARVPLSEIVIRTSRSSGPGGQHANVTASRVEAIFDVASSGSLTEEQKQRLMARLGPRVVAVAQDARSQARNRELALERLRRRLSGGLAIRRPRQPTRPTSSSVKRRLAAKRRRSEVKRGRRPPGGEE